MQRAAEGEVCGVDGPQPLATVLISTALLKRTTNMENENAMTPEQIQVAPILTGEGEVPKDPNDVAPAITTLFNIVAVIEILAATICLLYAIAPQSEVDAILHPHYPWFTEIWLCWSLGGFISALMFYGIGFALKCLDQIARKVRNS
jgi:hypothetical protein